VTSGGAISSYKDLAVWQRAIALSVLVYKLTRKFPREEQYGLTSQVRRSSVSIAANIAEGHGREQTKVFVQFLRVAQGSLKETETHVVIAREVELLDPVDAEHVLRDGDELGRMIRALIRSLEARVEKLE
jgi:four helix bundle protein